MNNKQTSQFQDVEQLKKSIKSNTKKCEKLEAEIKQAEQALTSLAQFQHSEVAIERLQFLDAQRHLTILKTLLAHTRALVACKIVELEKQIGAQNEFTLPGMGE